MSHLAGPYKVVTRNGNNYTIAELNNPRNQVRTNVTRLRPYIPSVRTDPVAVARVDKREFLIEKIVSHVGPKGPGQAFDRTNMQKLQYSFWVKWQGFPDSENTLESWTLLASKEPLHEYLRKHKADFMIPKSYGDGKKKRKVAPGSL